MAIGSSFHPGVFLDCSLIYSFVVGSHFRVKISEQIASAAQLAGGSSGLQVPQERVCLLMAWRRLRAGLSSSCSGAKALSSRTGSSSWQL